MCLHCQCVVYQSIDEIGVHIVNGAAVLSVPNETVVGEILLEVMALRYEEEVLNDSPLTAIRLENGIYMSGMIVRLVLRRTYWMRKVMHRKGEEMRSDLFVEQSL